MLNYKTAMGNLFEGPVERERNQDGDIRGGGGTASPMGRFVTQKNTLSIFIKISFC
jgi:hypothetical protein